MPENLPGRVSILRAFQQGDVVIIETDHHYTDEQMRNIKAAMSRDALGLKFVLLAPGMRVVAREEKPVE
jgi:hypothetical protein